MLEKSVLGVTIMRIYDS